jgi:zona occludens toxin (predicted ATPase)
MIDQYHKKGKHVICNFEVNENFWKKKHCKKNKYTGELGIIEELNNEQLTIDFLMDFANKNHERNARGQIKEKQTLLIIDECQTMFNSRSWNQKGRSEWVIFFTQHRKFGYTVILVSQHKDLIDKQIRHIFQHDYEHRNVKNFKLFGWFLALLCGGNLFFIPVKSMDTGKKDHTEIMFASKKYYKLYDSYKIFDTKTLKQL